MENSHHVRPRHLSNSAPLSDMVKLKSRHVGDKENSNPNQKTPGKRTSSAEKMAEVKRTVSGLARGEKEPYIDDIETPLHSGEAHNSTKGPIPQCYIDAIKQLNTLQSNVKALKDSRIKRGPVETKAVQVDQVLHYLSHLNVTEDDLRKLHFIHISGTKGKGSTSAYCESILRSHGYTTGFFSSPHLIEVRERIKLNGQPIPYEKFSKYFWEVYNALHANRRNPDDMPAYFKFLTVMSFYMFVKEHPDVCIMEVGIGGLYDNTNIIPNTDVVGITSLGFDHTAVLGNTLQEIAAQKAGILKPGCLAVTAQGQKHECQQVLLEKAKSLGCTMFEAPNIFNYNWKNHQVHDEEWNGTVQNINISLAIQLAYLMMFKLGRTGRFKKDIDTIFELIEAQKRSPSQPYLNPSILQGVHFEIDNRTIRGIQQCVWPGRVQVVRRNNIKYFLDGAHTNESIELCSKWFQGKSLAEESKSKPLTPVKDGVVRILVFNLTGDRDPSTLLPPLLKSKVNFDYILVTPNVISNETLPDVQYGGNRTVDRYGNKLDAHGHIQTDSPPRSKTDVHQITDSIRSQFIATPDSINNTTTNSEKLSGVQKIVNVAKELCNHRTKVIAFNSVLETYNFKHSLDSSKEYHWLVTGSLHLVGAFLNVLSNYEKS